MRHRSDESGARWRLHAAGLAGGLLALAAAESLAADFEVTNDRASGTGSLFQAVLLAEATIGADRIRFEPGFFGTAREIRLSHELPISESLAIEGPGRAQLTIVGPASSGLGVFIAESRAAPGSITISFTALTLRSDPTPGVHRRLILSNGANLFLQDVDLEGNGRELANQSGAAIALLDGDLVMDDCRVQRFVSRHRGGAIFVANSTYRLVRIERCAFRENGVSGDIDQVYHKAGGALFVDGGTLGPPGTKVEILHSEFSGNHSTNHGGAIAVHESAQLTLSNSTVSGNRARVGGGVTIYSTSGTPVALMPAFIEASTITDNLALQNGGGVAVFCTVYSSWPAGSALRLANTILAGNRSALAPPYNSREPAELYLFPESSQHVVAAHSLIGDEPGDAWRSIVREESAAPGTLMFDLDPRLGPLAFNGGPTRTHALQPDSPLIDAGRAGSAPRDAQVPFPVTDQRGAGFARRVGGEVDIGAFEYAAPGAGGGRSGGSGGGGASGLPTLASLLALALAVPASRKRISKEITS